MAITTSDDKNLRGLLYIVGQNSTPFLNMIGGLNGGKTVYSDSFALSVEATGSAPSQNTQSEDSAAAAGTPTTYAKSQSFNVTQLMKYDAQLTYKKANAPGMITGLNNTEDISSPDGLDFQKEMALLQLARDLDFSFLQGSYVGPSTSATDMKTRGILEAITTNDVDASAAVITKAMIDSLMESMYGNGAVLVNPVFIVPANQKVAISDLYGKAPDSRNVGGTNIQELETDFGNVGIVLEPNMPSDEVLLADLSVINPAFKADISWNDVAQVGASVGGFWYSEVGLDYGPETYHGKISNLI